VRYISYLAFPAALGLAVIAALAVEVVYGSKWAPAIPLIRILSVYGLFRSVGGMAGPLLSSMGDPGVTVRLTLFRLVLLAALVLPLGTYLGAAGVALSLMGSMALSVLLSLYIANRRLAIRPPEFGRSLATQCAAALVMAALVQALVLVLPRTPWALVVVVGLGAAAYVMVLWGFGGNRMRAEVAELVAITFGRGSPAEGSATGR
jgi:O-antigen/teichoic acid export membrane protein